ncbi:MAG: ATP synthase F1 subunit epsilon [Planctomycetota bacterium]|jgi:F-type H+-transporting ATPase subunit epsilon
MPRNTQLRCQLITPERAVLDVEATSVVFPAHDGQMGVLNRRAPLLCKVGLGICRIATPAGQQSYYVAGGFARMLDNNFTILTQEARSAAEIDLQEVERQLAEARGRPAPDLDAQQERRKAIERAALQIKLVKQR